MNFKSHRKEIQQERKIIFAAVNNAVKKHWGYISRQEAARTAAVAANRRGINVARAPYLEEIFIEALDKKEKEGALCSCLTPGQ